MGEIINGYELENPFQNKNAGFSRWTTAKKNDKVYVLKEFLNPIFPDEETLSDSLREGRIADCNEFRDSRKAFYSVINLAADGNLVIIQEFFRYDSHYYIATPFVEADGISIDDISRLPLEDRVLLCMTAAHSVMRLHQKHVVHSDIKDTNIIIHRTQTNKLVAKLIDFDCGFLEDKPPKSDEDLGGDQVYLAPEACQFMCGDSVALTCKMDVFSLGILFHQYLTGSLPEFNNEEYDYAHEALLDDDELEVSNVIPETLRELLGGMLMRNAEKRFSSEEVFGRLRKIYCPMNSIKEDNATVANEPSEFFYAPGAL